MMCFDSRCTRRQALKFAIGSFLGGIALKRFGVKPGEKLPIWPSGKTGIPEPGTRDQSSMTQPALTATELTILGALASALIPSDGQGPGAAEAAVAGRIAQSLGHSPASQATYKTGLSALNQLACIRYGSHFPDLPKDHQHQLLSFLDEIHRAIFSEIHSLGSRIRAKAYYWYYVKWGGLGPTLEFWRQLQSDVLTHFYSSPVAWAWLGYEGPPFPRGYLNQSEQPST